MRTRVGLTLLALVLAGAPVRAADEARLLRFPTIHGDKIVFTHAGNLYTVAASGGTARRLTSHDGMEMFARFSPDGQTLAFTGQYDGNTEVYVMPADGGVPKRLTYSATLGRDEVSDRMGPNNVVMGWKHDGKSILFRSRMRSFNDFIGQLYLVPIEGGLPEPLPLPRGGFASFSPDDSKLAYNRVFREFRTWKRYRGGMADDIWVYDFATKKTENITDHAAQDIIPMWHGDQIYFLSDRDSTMRMNLFVYDTKSKATKQLTDFKDFDIKFPSLGDKAIIFENGGFLYTFDLASAKTAKVPVVIHEDLAGGRGGLKDVSKNINGFDLSPDGKRALFDARGDVFSVPAQHGPTRNLTQTSGVHERNATWSPDGKSIAYISDASGEDEIYVAAQDGSGTPQAVTSGADTYKYEIFWSPDGKKILWSDKKFRLQFVDVATKKVTPVVSARRWEVRDFRWSPDSKWVVYAKPEMESFDRLYLYSVDGDKTVDVTDGWHDAANPTFSADGKYLFFTSDRDFNPTYSRTEWNHAYQDMGRIYLVTLAKETESPFKPQSDEVGEKPATDKPGAAAKPTPDKPASDKPAGDKPAGDKPAPDAAKDAAKKEVSPIKIDAEGLKDRVLSLPVPPSNYRNLASVGSVLYYVRQGIKDAAPALQSYDLAQQKETALGSVNVFDVSHDGKKMLVAKDGKYAIIDLPKAPVTLGETLNLSGLEVQLDREQEWKEIYNECWRQMRDFFYDPGMNGVDWKAVKAKYEPLVGHVHHRADLTYIIGEMIGELNAGHCYVGGGDLPPVPRITTGLLGAELKRDAGLGVYKIAKILKGANWDRSLRSPLTEIGVDVKEGDFILAVNGKPTSGMNNIYEALINTAGKPVTLKVASSPDAKPHDVVVTPIADEAKLYYHDWVEGNIKKVSEASGGKIGYVHVPDMGVPGLNEFAKYFYPQLRKKALIIDVRGNGGGNVSPMLIDRLRREQAMVAIARNGPPTVEPPDAFVGPMACLLNEFSASDGDIFPYRFRHYKLGPLIGKRSWGGVIGIRGTLPLLDGGNLSKPEFSRFDIEGKKWIMEGIGVEPDIVVDNDPAKEYAGTDEQLNKAVEVLLKDLKTKERTLPDAPPFPKK